MCRQGGIICSLLRNRASFHGLLAEIPNVIGSSKSANIQIRHVGGENGGRDRSWIRSYSTFGKRWVMRACGLRCKMIIVLESVAGSFRGNT